MTPTEPLATIHCLYCGGVIVISQAPDGLSPLQLLQGAGFIVECPHCRERSPLRFTASPGYDTRGGWPHKGWVGGGADREHGEQP